jgi:protein-L-isoaspartate(D-aspartate) O-methyltransferase
MATMMEPWYPHALEQRGDPCVLAALASVPPALFGRAVPPLRTVSAMIEALALRPDDRVLEIGTGSGYTAAALSMLAAHVYTVEPDPEQSREARELLDAFDYDWIGVRCDDGALGWPEHAPFDAILVHEPARDLPEALLDQLAIGGRLVIPIHRGVVTRIVRATRVRPAEHAIEELGPLLQSL